MTGATLPSITSIPTIPRISSRGEGGATSIEMDVVVNFSDGTGALTATKLSNGSHGASWGTWTNAHNGVGGAANTHTNIVDHDVQLPFNIDVGGTLYNGSEGQGAEFDFSSEPTEYDAFQLTFSASVSDCVLLALVRPQTTLIPGSETTFSNDLFVFTGGNYSLTQLIHSFNTSRLALTHSEGSFGMLLGTFSDWMLLSLKHDVTNGQGLFFIQRITQSGPNWVLGDPVGLTRSVMAGAGDIANMRFQSYLRPARGAGSTDVKLFAMRESDLSFPPYDPGSLTGPTAVDASRTALEEITVTIGGPYQLVRLERQTNGGAWSTLDASLDIAFDITSFEYVDTTVTEPNTYAYRATGLVGDYETATTTSGSVDLSEPFAEWHDGISLASATSTQAFTDPNGYAVANYATLPAGTVNKLRLYVEAITGTVSVKMALYAPSGDDALLTSSSLDISSTGWAEFDVADEVITAGDYLIAFHLNPTGSESITVKYGAAAPATQRYDLVAYASFPLDPHGLTSVGSSAYASGALITPP